MTATHAEVSSLEGEEGDRLQDPHAFLWNSVWHASWLWLEEVSPAVESVKLSPVLLHLFVSRIPSLCGDIGTPLFNWWARWAGSTNTLQEAGIQPVWNWWACWADSINTLSRDQFKSWQLVQEGNIINVRQQSNLKTFNQLDVCLGIHDGV